MTGIWVPLTSEVRATALRMFFHKVAADYTIPEPPPEPEHYAIIFPLKKKDEVSSNTTLTSLIHKIGLRLYQ